MRDASRPEQVPLRRRYDGNVLNWVVIGIGDITTRRVLPAITQGTAAGLYGVVSRDPDKGRRYAPRVWTSLDDALADPAVDLVYVATPVFLHAPQTIAALRAGKHVLCEKPMALNYPEACAMVQAARETGRTLGVAYYRRTYPKLRRAQELMAQGAIGRPVFAEAKAHDWFNNEDGGRGWFLDPAQAGGGPLYDTASHRIDVFNFLFGQPVAVAAQLSNVVHQAAVEDAATMLIDYESGLRAVVDARRHSRIARDEFRIIGTDGEIDLTPLNGPELRHPGSLEQIPNHPNLHFPLIENFVEAVVHSTQLISTGETALLTDWVTAEALKSSARALNPRP